MNKKSADINSALFILPCYTQPIQVTTMNLDNPFFLITFFSIFHVFGGLAFGKGMKDVISNSGQGKRLLIWGAFMGISPILFDWLFLIQAGMLFYGLIGPALFIIATIIGWVIKISKIYEKSIGIILMGLASLLIGISLAPFLITQALTLNLQPVDYIFGSCLLVMPILVGIGFLSSGLKAVRKKQSYDEHIAQHEIEIEEKISKPKKKK